jgi:hypothetical protein
MDKRRELITDDDYRICRDTQWPVEVYKISYDDYEPEEIKIDEGFVTSWTDTTFYVNGTSYVRNRLVCRAYTAY